MIRIPLTRGKYAIVDDLDAKTLLRWKWRYSSKGYAIRSIRVAEGTQTIWMHREVNRTPPGYDTDHVNMIKLDNRRVNLRTCTRSQNHMNRSLRRDNTSGAKGVVWHQQRHKWAAYIRLNGHHLYLGLFDTSRAAATAYRSAAKKYHGNFART